MNGPDLTVPFVRRVRVRGFRSIAGCEVALGPLTVLLGFNASGKSNLLDVLRFVADALHGSVPQAVADRGGLGALLHRGPDGTMESFEIRLDLALPPRQLPPIRFRHDHLPVLVAAAQGLRERIPEEGVLIVGNVVRLHREETGSGEVSIAGVIEGEDRLRRFWVNLPQADYDQAVRAHREMLSVSVRGDLVRRATRLHLRNPTAFQVLTDLVEP